MPKTPTPLLDRVWSPQHAALVAQGNDPRAIEQAIDALTWIPRDTIALQDNPLTAVDMAQLSEALNLTDVALLAPAQQLTLTINNTLETWQLCGIQARTEDREVRIYIADDHTHRHVLGYGVIPTSTGPWPIETHRKRRGHRFYPTRPLHRTGATRDIPAPDRIIREHYFVAGSDWWITEAETNENPADNRISAFGYYCLNDSMVAEWGSVDLHRLEHLTIQRGRFVVERDLNWEPIPARDAKLPGRPFSSTS